MFHDLRVLQEHSELLGSTVFHLYALTQRLSSRNSHLGLMGNVLLPLGTPLWKPSTITSTLFIVCRDSVYISERKRTILVKEATTLTQAKGGGREGRGERIFPPRNEKTMKRHQSHCF